MRRNPKRLTFWQEVGLNLAMAAAAIVLGWFVLRYMQRVGVEAIQEQAKRASATPTPMKR